MRYYLKGQISMGGMIELGYCLTYNRALHKAEAWKALLAPTIDPDLDLTANGRAMRQRVVDALGTARITRVAVVLGRGVEAKGTRPCLRKEV